MQDVSDLLASFRDSRGQTLEHPTSKPEKQKNPYSDTPTRFSSVRMPGIDKYQDFLKKYENLELEIDLFTASDLMYYFREKARESGFKYVIANMKRDIGIFKKLLKSYTVREICLMIEFIFFSPQNYLDKMLTQPTVLASSWCNSIYRDSMLWVDDKYAPRENTLESKKSRIKKREWNHVPTKESATIGEWS